MDRIKLKADKFVNDKKLKLNYIKPKNLKLLLAEFCEEQIAELKAECDLAIEGRDVRIKELESTVGTLRTFSNEQAACVERLENETKMLGERCNQLLKDKGALLDQIEKMKCYLPVDERDSVHKWFAYKKLFDTEWKIDYSVQGELPKCNTIKWFENKEAVMFYLVSNGMKYYEEPRG